MSFGLRSDFVRNVATLMTGTTIAQALPIAVSPILTRLYTPEDFGVLALFVSVTTIFGTVANARYELALMLPATDDEALNAAALALLICTGLSVVLLILTFAFNSFLSSLLGNAEIGPWLYLVGPTVFLLGLFNILNYYNNRLLQYRDIARATVGKALALSAIQVTGGMLHSGAAGLIVGQFAASAFANTRLLRNTLARFDWRGSVCWMQMKAAAVRYRDFPLFSMPAAFANTLSYNLTNVIVSAFYSISTLGLYAIVYRVLGIPTALVGSSVGQVFFQRAASEKARTGRACATFDQTVTVLVLLSLPFFLVAFWVAEDVFAFVFGEPWRVAGTYARILAPFFAVRFVVSAVSTLTSVFEKQRLALAWQLALLIVTLGSVFVSVAFGLEFRELLIIIAVSSSLCYALLGYLLFLVSRARL